MKSRWLITAVLTTLAALWALPAGAEWSHDPTENTPVCTTTDSQTFPQVLSDGGGGAFISWDDNRASMSGIYMQRVDSSGNMLWDVDGKVVSNGEGSIYAMYHNLVSDGEDGAIVVWRDDPDSYWDVYAQRIDASGNILWGINGEIICNGPYDQDVPDLVTDGAGGAIIAWVDYSNYSSNGRDICAQRVDDSGNTLWATDGIAICTETGSQHYLQLKSDNAGGAIIVWEDYRSGSGSGTDIYAQRVDGSGNALWAVNGTAICTETENQNDPQLISDSADGAIIVWRDYRLGSGVGIYAQRVDGSGNALWAMDGVAICTETGLHSSPQLMSDGAGGTIIVWQDERSGSDRDIYCQRLDDTGALLWAIDGVAVCTAAGSQFLPQLVSDGAGGGTIIWRDLRSGSDSDIYAQKVDESGNMLWTTNGVAVSTAIETQDSHQSVSDGAGGAIIAWRDYRVPDQDIYAQRIRSEGFICDPTPVITELIDHPGDQGGVVVLDWTPSCVDVAPYVYISHYSVWKRIPDPATTPRTTPATLSGWSHEMDVTASYLEEYTVTAPAYGIYTGSGEIPWTEYKILAHTDDHWVFWESDVVSGYSVDNLAPGAPLALTGTPSGADIKLSWSASGHHDEDLAFYLVYRSDIPGFTPDESTLIGTTAGTDYTDPTPGTGTWHYLVTGQDIHGNEGLPSNEASAATALTSTVSASLTCTPPSGIVPFSSAMTIRMENLDLQRPATRISGRIEIQLANGSSCSNWRQGWTNVIHGSPYSVTWPQTFPVTRAIIGNNVFTLTARDVTPSPYNQPPYPPSGDTATDTCTVTANAQ